MVITGSDSLQIDDDTAVVAATSISRSRTSTLGKADVSEGNVWYPATTCPGTMPSISS